MNTYICMCKCTSVHEGYSQPTSKRLAMVAISYKYIYLYTYIQHVYMSTNRHMYINIRA